ncbi:hypothetical protein TNCV_4435121 [Trichonephila clavipes]|nr:hypothetical protein TNCV_4435121 [Trichonephila clavipes]
MPGCSTSLCHGRDQKEPDHYPPTPVEFEGRQGNRVQNLWPTNDRWRGACRSSCAAEQFRSNASLEAVDRRALNNSKNWQWTTEGDVSARRLTPAPVNDRTAFSPQLVARWFTVTGVLMSASSIRRCLLYHGLRAREPLYKIPPHGKPLMAASAMGS